MAPKIFDSNGVFFAAGSPNRDGWVLTRSTTSDLTEPKRLVVPGSSSKDFLAVGSPKMFVFGCSDFGGWPKSDCGVVVAVEPANGFPNPDVGLEIATFAVAEVATFLKRSGVSTGFSIDGVLLLKMGATCEDGAESVDLKSENKRTKCFFLSLNFHSKNYTRSLSYSTF